MSESDNLNLKRYNFILTCITIRFLGLIMIGNDINGFKICMSIININT